MDLATNPSAGGETLRTSRATGAHGRSPARNLLLVDADTAFGLAVQQSLALDHIVTTLARSGRELRQLLCRDPPAWRYACVAVSLPDVRGPDLIPEIRASAPATTVALLASHVSFDMQLAALQEQRILVVKPAEPADLAKLLEALDRNAATIAASDLDEFGAFTIARAALCGPTGDVTASMTGLAILRVLRRSEAGFVSSSELARMVLNRRDPAASDLIRRHILDLRRSLGSYSWIVESRHRGGYRLSPAAYAKTTAPDA